MNTITNKHIEYLADGFDTMQEAITYIERDILLHNQKGGTLFSVINTGNTKILPPENIKVVTNKKECSNDGSYPPGYHIEIYFRLNEESSIKDLICLKGFLQHLILFRGTFNNYRINNYQVIYLSHNGDEEVLYEYSDPKEG